MSASFQRVFYFFSKLPVYIWALWLRSTRAAVQRCDLKACSSCSMHDFRDTSRCLDRARDRLPSMVVWCAAAELRVIFSFNINVLTYCFYFTSNIGHFQVSLTVWNIHPREAFSSHPILDWLCRTFRCVVFPPFPSKTAILMSLNTVELPIRD